MPYTTINVGTSPNDNTGDTIRNAFIKVNNNFTASIITGSSIGSASVSSYSTSGSVTLTSANISYYVDLSNGTSGIQPTYVGSGLTFNPSTNTLATNAINATTITGTTLVSTNNVQVGGNLINALGLVGTSNNFVGVNAGFGGSSTTNNNFFGTSAGYNATATNNSNFQGYNAGYNATNANYSNFFGFGSGNGAAFANYSNFFGKNAGNNATNAANSNFHGYASGQNAIYANNSNFLGNLAGNAATSASNSNFFGVSAGNGAAFANNSIFIGYASGQNDIVNNSFGHSSILIGDYTNTGGYKDSISIGKGTKSPSSASLNIGNVIYATGIYTSSTSTSASIVGGKVGIGTYIPINKLDVVGNISCSVITASLFFGTASVSNSGSVTLSSTNASYYIDLSTGTSGIQPTYVGSGLTFNPATNTLLTTNVTASSIRITTMLQMPYSSSLQTYITSSNLQTGSQYLFTSATTNLQYVYNGTRWCSASLA